MLFLSGFWCVLGLLFVVARSLARLFVRSACIYYVGTYVHTSRPRIFHHSFIYAHLYCCGKRDSYFPITFNIGIMNVVTFNTKTLLLLHLVACCCSLFKLFFIFTAAATTNRFSRVSFFSLSQSDLSTYSCCWLISSVRIFYLAFRPWFDWLITSSLAAAAAAAKQRRWSPDKWASNNHHAVWTLHWIESTYGTYVRMHLCCLGIFVIRAWHYTHFAFCVPI